MPAIRAGQESSAPTSRVPATFDAIAALSFEAIGEHPPPLGQRMLGRSGDFGERQTAIAPGDDMARGGDVEPGGEFAALPRAGVMHL